MASIDLGRAMIASSVAYTSPYHTLYECQLAAESAPLEEDEGSDELSKELMIKGRHSNEYHSDKKHESLKKVFP